MDDPSRIEAGWRPFLRLFGVLPVSLYELRNPPIRRRGHIRTNKSRPIALRRLNRILAEVFDRVREFLAIRPEIRTSDERPDAKTEARPAWYQEIISPAAAG